MGATGGDVVRRCVPGYAGAAMAGSRMRRSVPRRIHNKIKRQIYEDILVGIAVVLQLCREFWKGLQQSEKVVTTARCEVEGAPEINSHEQILQQSEVDVTIPDYGVGRCPVGSSYGQSLQQHQEVVTAPACEVESGPEVSSHEALRLSEEQREEVFSTSDFVVEGGSKISSHGLGHSYSDVESNNSIFTSDLRSVPGVSSNMDDFMNSLPQLPIFPEKHKKMQEQVFINFHGQQRSDVVTVPPAAIWTSFLLHHLTYKHI